MATIDAIEAGAASARGLGSPRDRARLRERVSAERARVERVLARGPREVERRRVPREATQPGDRPIPAGTASTSIPVRIHSGAAARTGCGLCGGRDVIEDEVGAGREGILLLGQCRRCDHRWTDRIAARFVPRVRRPEPRSREIRTAAGGRGATAG